MKKLLIFTALFINTLFAADLGVDYKTLRSRVVDDFNQVGLSYKMPKKLKTTGDNPDIQVGSVYFDKGSGGNITLNKDKKVSSVMMMVSPTKDDKVNLSRYFAVAFAVSAVARESDKRIVGGDVLKMLSDLLGAFSKDPSKVYKDSVVHSGIKYGIVISSGVPVVVYAEPVNG